MRFFKGFGIGFKVIALAALLAAVFLGSAFTYVAVSSRNALIASTLGTLHAEILSEQRNIETYMFRVRSMLLAVKGTAPVQGILRARANNGFDALDNSTLEQWRARLRENFKAEMRASRLYSQLRYIDENGMEVVRVDLVSGEIRSVPDEELQEKGDREYFLQAKKLSDGDIYVSYTELNKEGTPPRVSVPYTPTIRYATPVFDAKSRKNKGIIIANVLVDQVVAESDLLNTSSFDAFVINSFGYFIVHPNPAKEWGGSQDLNTGFRLETEFPLLSKSDFSGKNGLFQKGGDVIAYAKIQPDTANPNQEWIIMEKAPTSIIFSPINTTIANAIKVGVGAFFALFFVFLFVIRKIFQPLQDLISAAERIGLGDFWASVSVRSRDEIGTVAEAFNAMAQKLRTSHSLLEQRIQEKTQDLSGKVGELEKTQTAMSNILEDLEDERKKLTSSTQRLALATESAKIGVWEWDIDNDVLSWDAQMRALYGIGDRAFEGTRSAWRKFLHPDDKKAEEEALQLALQDKKNFDTDFRIVRPGGEVRYVRAYALVERDEFGKPRRMIGVNFDITHEKEIDRAKSEFVSLASHQLRTPLSAINWYTEMLLAGDAGPLNEEQKSYLKEVAVGNKRMVDLVDALLNTSRLELGTFIIDPVPTDVAVLVNSVLSELKSDIVKKKLVITDKFNKSLPKFTADEKLLRIVVQNLLSNAVKYTQEGGEILVSLDVMDNGQKFGNKKIKGRNMVLMVRDSGMGIPVSQQGKIFSKLFRADNAKESEAEGTGLGLYIIKSIIEQSGGSVWFESEEKKGTAFYVAFPIMGMKAKTGSKKLE